MSKKLGIFGPYPPPLGGMSVHIKRIESFLVDLEIPYTIFNHGHFQKDNVIPTRKNPLFYLKILFNKKYGYFHFHQLFFFEFIFYFLFAQLNKTPFLITIHAETLLKTTSIKRKLALFLIKKSKMKVISVSENLNDLLVQNNVDSIFLPAYVPPEKVSFIPVQATGKILFMFSMWKFNAQNAQGSYNAPLIFEFLRQNKDAYRMLFLIGTEDGSDKVYLKKSLAEYDIENAVEILYSKNLVDYIQNCRFLIRTNRIDGYGVSLQEAMDLGVPAIATSVCTRPKGTIFFKNNDLVDMTEKIIHVVNENPENILRHKEELTYHHELLKIYQENL